MRVPPIYASLGGVKFDVHSAEPFTILNSSIYPISSSESPVVAPITNGLATFGNIFEPIFIVVPIWVPLINTLKSEEFLIKAIWYQVFSEAVQSPLNSQIELEPSFDEKYKTVPAKYNLLYIPVPEFCSKSIWKLFKVSKFTQKSIVKFSWPK